MAERRVSDLLDTRHNLSFAGCGFLGLYHVGVCACIRKFAPQLYLNRPVSGASAGSIAAVSLICDVNIADCVQYMCQLIANARKYTLGPFDPRFKISEHLKEGLSRLLPSDAHLLSSGRLFISLTNYNTGKNIVVSQYKDRDELISPVIDGGLSDNLLGTNKFTIKVSPFAGDADICPLDTPWGPNYNVASPQRYEDILGSVTFSNNTIRLNTTNIKRFFSMVWPMTPDELVSLAVQGYYDTIRFLTTRGFIACQLHRTPRRFSTVSNERKLSSSICATAHRIRRLNDQRNFNSISPHTTDDLKTQSAGDLGSLDIPKSPLPYRPLTPIIPLHGSGVGFNVSRCVHCQEELRKALGSVLPNFLRTIILDSSPSRSASRAASVSTLRKLFNLSFNWMKNGIASSSLRILTLGCQLISLSLVWQLDFVINILSKCINLFDRLKLTTIHLRILLHIFIEGKKLLHVLNSITNSQPLSSLPDNDQSYGSLTSPDSISNPTNIFFPTSTLKHRKSDNLADLIHSLIDSSSERLTDLIFGMSTLKLPLASDCGLELFSPGSGDWSNKPRSSPSHVRNKQDDSDTSTAESVQP